MSEIALGRRGLPPANREVIVAPDCVAPYDAEHHEVTKRYLDAGIARFVSGAGIAKMLAP